MTTSNTNTKSDIYGNTNTNNLTCIYGTNTNSTDRGHTDTLSYSRSSVLSIYYFVRLTLDILKIKNSGRYLL